MVISLHRDQDAWLQMRVASGGFGSIEDTVRQLIDNQIVQQRELENDDLAWPKPLVDEGIAADERGEFITLDEHRARNRTRLASLKR